MALKVAIWKRYIDKKKGAPPRELLLEAVSRVPGRGTAIDLGAGPMNDCRYLLNQGFERVVAVDYDETAEECSKEFADDARFSFAKSRFDEFQFPLEVDLVNAAYALPFNPSWTFAVVLQAIHASLKKGGVFCGQFFGINDSWNVPRTAKTFLTRAEAEKCLAEYEILKFLEEEQDGTSSLGEPKHWHVFHFIMRK